MRERERNFFPFFSFSFKPYCLLVVSFTFHTCLTENDGVWGHWVVGNDEEGAWGFEGFDSMG